LLHVHYTTKGLQNPSFLKKKLLQATRCKLLDIRLEIE